MIIKKNHVERIKRDYKNFESVYVGKGKHYIQEDSPHEIGIAIKTGGKDSNKIKNKNLVRPAEFISVFPLKVTGLISI